MRGQVIPTMDPLPKIVSGQIVYLSDTPIASNRTDPGSSGAGGGQVPEPSSLALALVAQGSVTAFRRARASRV